MATAKTGTRSVARLVRFPVAGGLVLGAWIGFALGLLLGTIVAALAVWFADAVLLWERDLSYTLGVGQELLPFGDQVPTLETVRSWWYLFIPAVGLLLSVLMACFGALVGALLSIAYNHLPLHGRFTIEVE